MTPRDDGMSKGRPQRIVIVGSSNAGKSTLAARLAKSLDAPFVELDAIYWLPNWVGRDDEDFGAKVREAVAGDSWVVAGNYRRVAQPFIWPEAQLVVWLDLPLRTTLPRLIRRSWERSRSGELLWGTNREVFWRHLKLWDQEQSLIAFLLRNHRAQRARYLDAMQDPQWAHIRFVQLRSPGEVEVFAREFEAQTQG